MAGPSTSAAAAANQPAQSQQHRKRSSSASSTASDGSAASTLGPPSSTASSPLLHSLSPTTSRSSRGSGLRRYFGRGGRGSSRKSMSQRQRQRARLVAFSSAILSALCAGSITVFSLYGHIFQERLRYTQFEVNGVAIAGSVSSYLPVPVLGYLCDRLGPAPLSLAASVIFGAGYSLAAAVFASVDATVRQQQQQHGRGNFGHGIDGFGVGAWSEDPGSAVGGGPLAYALMVAAFVCIGIGTASMYLSAVATCAKNFGKGKHRGLALAMPIAAFGLSGMWQSQFGSRVLYERLPDGSHGDVDVVRFFAFLAAVLAFVGLVGFFFLRVVDEEELIDEAVEELERSGLLEGSALFSPTLAANSRLAGGTGPSYGAIERSDPFESLDGTIAGVRNADTSRPLLADPEDEGSVLDGAEGESEEAKLKKAWVLDAETRRFITDHTMWLFAAGFFFMVGPGEAFINNLGTVLQTLQPPSHAFRAAAGSATSAATHVSIVGVTSTVARLATGTLTDLLAPSPQAQHVQLSASQILNTIDQDREELSQSPRRRFSASRVVFLLFFAVLLSVGLATLATGVAQNHAERFWVVSMLVGFGYGGVFSLTPLITTVIWGVENFATNWGIIATMPALGATMWGLIYSSSYTSGAGASPSPSDPAGNGDGGGGAGNEEDIFCYGTQCYAPTFWAMSVSVWIACGLVMLAWKGRNGWAQRGIVI